MQFWSDPLESTITTNRMETQERRFCAEGFRPGVSPQSDERTNSIDVLGCRQLRCPDCRTRRLVYRPFTA